MYVFVVIYWIRQNKQVFQSFFLRLIDRNDSTVSSSLLAFNFPTGPSLLKERNTICSGLFLSLLSLYGIWHVLAHGMAVEPVEEEEEYGLEN